MTLALIFGETESRWFQILVSVLEGLVAGAFTVGAAIVAVLADRRRRQADDRRRAIDSVMEATREVTGTVTRLLVLALQTPPTGAAIPTSVGQGRLDSEWVRLAEHLNDTTTVLIRAITDGQRYLPPEIVDARTRISHHSRTLGRNAAAIPLIDGSGEPDLAATDERLEDIAIHGFALGPLFKSMSDRLRAELAPTSAGAPPLDFDLLGVIEQLYPVASEDDEVSAVVEEARAKLLAKISAREAARPPDAGDGHPSP